MLHALKDTLKKRFIPWILTILVCASALVPAFGEEVVLYQDITGFPVTGGVTYEAKTLFTSQGWQKIHILRVNLDSENVDVDTIIGKNGLSQRDSLSKMVQNSGAVAGINGDFFVTATPSAPIGPQISNGKLIATPLSNLGMSAFGITFDKLPEILNLEFTGRLIAPDRSYFTVEGVNKIRNSYNNIFVYTPEFGSTTPKPGEGAPTLTFATVRDNRIVSISEGQTAPIPEDGLVLMAWGDGANFLKTKFSTGDPIQLDLNFTPDISNLKMLLGGGGVLVENGQIPKSFSHEISGTHPRTAIGFSADKKTLIMVVVDGRQAQSRGMTQRELAELMLSLGAHYALNLDGGGSSTMVAKPFYETQPKVINNPSEGTQRLIPNAIGVFAKSSVGQVSGLKITASSFNIPNGGRRTFSVIAYDKNYNIIDIDPSDVTWSVKGDVGYFSGNVFTAQKSGTGQVLASYRGIQASQDIRVLKDTATLKIEPERVQVNPGSKTVFNVYVTDSDGYKAPLEAADAKLSLVGEIGAIHGLELTAGQSPANGAVIAEFAGLKAGALVQTGYKSILLDDFESIQGKAFEAYPQYVKGSFTVTSLPDPVYSGQFSGRLTYDFTGGTATRAAYLAFQNGKTLPEGTVKFGIGVYGQGQGEWLRASILDASGKETLLDLAKSVDWQGWRWVEAKLPTGKAPFKIKSIYVVETDPGKAITGSIYLDDLTAFVSGTYDESLLPATYPWIDAANKKGSGFIFGALGTMPEANQTNISMLSLAKDILNKNKTSFNVIAGKPWADEKTVANQLSDLNSYKFSGGGYALHATQEATFIFLDASKGSMRSTDYKQWLNLQSDLKTVATSKPLFVVIDRAPEKFSDSLEGELLKKLLSEHAQSTGQAVWVLAGGQASAFSISALDGVRYVSIPNINATEAAVLIFYVANGQVNYQVVPLVNRISNETPGVKAGVSTNLRIYGITPGGNKIPMGYPYAGEWQISYDRPVIFDSRSLSFKADSPGTATIQLKLGDSLYSFPIMISDVSVYVNGKEVLFPDQVPYINKDSRTMVPVRFVSESLGAKVSWDNDNRMVIIQRGNDTIKLKIGENKAEVNGKTVSFDTAAVLQNDRTMVPVRFISEALGAKVSWNQEKKAVEIEY